MLTFCFLTIVAALIYLYMNRDKDSEPQKTEVAAPAPNKSVEPKKTKSPKVHAHQAEIPIIGQTKFPYPAKNPSKCRFPGDPETTNFQEYGEEPIEMRKEDFKSWWFFSEDSDKPCWSYVGTDKYGHCILQRRYRHGTPDHYTFEIRHFLIKRNIMASAFALALTQDHMERTDYFELIERLDKQFPKTGNPEEDGPEILLPPHELLDNPSKEEIERAEQEKERQELSGKVVYLDYTRKLYFAEDGHTPMMDYNGKTYTLSCHPYEPMLIIRYKGEDVAHIHNAFYPDDEYKSLLKGQLVHSITGKYHNAERFARLLTTALDTGYENIGDVENRMMVGLALDKGAENIEYAAYDFKCTKVLYEGVALLLGYFDCTTEIVNRKSSNRQLIYALAFGYPHNGTDMYEYYLISEEEYKEYKEYKEWPERQDGQNHEAAYAWHEAHLAGKQVLCNEFSHMQKNYKPFFKLSEIKEKQTNRNNQRIPCIRKSTSTIRTAPISIRYSRTSVCAQDDYVNSEHMMKLPPDATVKDLIGYIFHYQDDDGYAALPYTGVVGSFV